MKAILSTSLRLLAAVLLLGAAPGCTALGASKSGRTGAAARVAPSEQPMDQARMELIFGEQVDAIEGPSGALRTIKDGVEVYLISDPENDQMRLLSRIAPASQLDPRIFNFLLQANFYLTVDARYAVSEGIVFGVYIHPLSSLTRAELISGLEQVIGLAKNFGTTFSSGRIEFGLPDGTER